MVQKIGKSFFLSGLLFCSLFADSGVLLRVMDMNGQQLTTLGLGVPFIVDVEISGEGAGISEPDVKTSPAIALMPGGTSSSVRTINGHTTVKKNYRYQATVDREGTYLIGPASVEKDGTQIASNSVELQVSAQPQKAESGQHEKVFLEISTSKNNVYWAEAVTFTLRFYHLDDVRLDSIAQPTFPGCKASELKGPVSGTESRDGIMYRYLEWKALLYPEEVGRITLPAVGAHVTMQDTARSSSQFDVFSMMDHMLGGSGQRKTIYSNALILQVKELPEYQEKVTAVGLFTGLSAKVNLDQASQGEGIVYTLELVGAGNFSMLGHPQLTLPEGLKHYESNTKFHSLGAGMHKKDFEYVVQGIEPGSYTIEPQTVTYFDVKNHAYKTLKTKPILVTIAGQKEIKTETIKPDMHDENQSDIFLVEHGTKWRVVPGRFIPWFWFLLLALIPRLFLFLRSGLRFWRNYQERNTVLFNYKNAFKQARLRIKECGKNPKPVDLYHICIDFFAARLQITKSEVSEAVIERALQQRGMSVESIEAWRQFFTHITEAAFASDSSLDTAHIATLLLEWISKFERIL